MPKFEPGTVPVQVIRTLVDPSPVFAELEPGAPRPEIRKPARPKNPPKAAAAPAPAPER